MTNTAKAQTPAPAPVVGTMVRVTRGTYKGREARVYAVVNGTYILEGISSYLKPSSLKAI